MCVLELLSFYVFQAVISVTFHVNSQVQCLTVITLKRNQLAHWCTPNNLELNMVQTVEMTADFSRSLSTLPPITILNSSVSAVEGFSFIGFTILKCVPNFNQLKKVQQSIYFLRQLSQELARQSSLHSSSRSSVCIY